MSDQHKFLITCGACGGLGMFGLIAGLVWGDPALGAAILVFYLLAATAVAVGRKRGFALTSYLTGVGDERARNIYRQAGSRTTDMFGVVIAAWAIVAMARHGQIDDSLFAVMLIYSGLWVLNICVSMYAASVESAAARRTDLGH